MNALPFYIPRIEMPQVDHMEATLAWLNSRGVGSVSVRVEASQLRRHQHVLIDPTRALAIPDDKLRAPILIASDGYVVDGNHRQALLAERGEQVSAWRLSVSFGEAITLLSGAPGVDHSAGEQ